MTQDSGETGQTHQNPLQNATLNDRQTDNGMHSQQFNDNINNDDSNQTDKNEINIDINNSEGINEEYNDSNEHNQIPDYEDDDDQLDQQRLDQIAQILGERDCHTAGEGMTFAKLCKRHNIPYEMHDAYYSWLMTLRTDNGMRYNQSIIPRAGPRESKGGYIEPGLKIPPPYGQKWREILESKNLKRSKHNKLRVLQANCTIMHTINSMYTAVKNIHKIMGTENVTGEELHALRTMKKRRHTAVAAGSTGNKQPPTSISKALRQEDIEEAFKWLQSINKEWNGLCELGVLKHDLTRSELRQMGIEMNPINFSICLTYKFDDTGAINRYKSRFAIAGHAGNLQKGIHYEKTYASTPSQNSTRLLQAIMVKYRMRRLAFDVEMAYPNADLPKHEHIAVRYPDGFKRYRTVNGRREELYMALIKNLYGLPQAGRHWEKTRNREILKIFDKKPWTIKQCIKEPCLFYITRHTTSGVERVYALIHTDDADVIGDNDEVLQAVYSKISNTWTCKQVDPSFMLGIKRTVTETPDEMTVTCTMQAFVEGAAMAFE